MGNPSFGVASADGIATRGCWERETERKQDNRAALQEPSEWKGSNCQWQSSSRNGSEEKSDP